MRPNLYHQPCTAGLFYFHGQFFNHNGHMMPAGQEVQDRATRSCRTGNGLFETMRIHYDGILLPNYHFDRLYAGMEALKLDIPVGMDTTRMKDLIHELCLVNGHQPAARVRLSVFHGEQKEQSQFIIESWPLDPMYSFPDGLTIGIYTDDFKKPDVSSPFKTNYQLYVAAAAHAKEQSWDDCLVLNSAGNICDASIANIFWVKDGEIATPPLSEGCIGGVMRRYLVNALQEKRFPIVEKVLTTETLLHADETFLTNVIRGIRPVEKFQTATYSKMLSKKIFDELVLPLLFS